MQSSPTRSRNKCTTIYRKSFTGAIAATASVPAARFVQPGVESTVQCGLEGELLCNFLPLPHNLRHPYHVLREKKVTRGKVPARKSQRKRTSGGYKRHDKEKVQGIKT